LPKVRSPSFALLFKPNISGPKEIITEQGCTPPEKDIECKAFPNQGPFGVAPVSGCRKGKKEKYGCFEEGSYVIKQISTQGVKT
jgi:hypothetical protein